MAATINSERLSALLAEINRFGRIPGAEGFFRPAFGEADMAVRRHFETLLKADGLATHVDAAGNVFGRHAPDGAAGPAIMVGSHLDTVPAGGAFDGALGVAVALECVRAIREAAIPLAHPIEVVATADEEGRFGGMLGSQAIAGVLADGWAESAADAEGETLAEAMRGAGLDADRLAEAARPPGSVGAFLELHIEQGPVLETTGRDVGVVTAVSGCAVLAVSLVGAANHSGTTPMDLRHDAFVGMARIGSALPGLARRLGTDQSRLTIGHVEIAPNAVHTIPGAANFTIVVRDVDRKVMVALRDAIGALAAEVAADLGLAVSVETRSWLDPVALDAGLRERALAEAALLGIDAVPMPSGAGHDAQTMAAFCPTALLFVPSRGGISHAPQEFTPWPAIERGAAVLLAFLVALAT